MNKMILLASLLAAGLIAAEADYQTQQNSADKAFNELDGKDSSNKDLELQKKELEIERLKLELEKKKLAEEKAQQPASAPSYQAPQPTVRTSNFYLGFETYNASGTQTTKLEADGYDSEEYEEDATYTQRRLVIGFGRVNENRFEIGLSSGRSFSGDSGFNDKIEEDGTGLDLTWNIVASSMYNAHADTNVLPFFKIGFGYGVYDLTDEFTSAYDTTETQIVEFDFKLGLGAYIQLNENMEFSASYDITGMVFQPIEYETFIGTVTETNSASVSGLSLGFNFHF